MDRKIAPQIKKIEEFKLKKARTLTLKNGITLYLQNDSEKNVIRLDWLLEAGTLFQEKKLTSAFTNEMLCEGCKGLDSKQIAEAIDFYGIWHGQNVGKRFICHTFQTLAKYIDKAIELSKNMIFFPSFPEKEFEVRRTLALQRYSVNSQKVAVLANRNFVSQIYGKNHPYGQVADENDYKNIQLDCIKRFHNDFFTTKNCIVIATGHITTQTENILIQKLEEIPTKENYMPQITIDAPQPSAEKIRFTQKDNAMQDALVIGSPLYEFDDYKKLCVMNTLFGGYFGSRLMSNIREDKGYTYGIQSSVVRQQHYGHFAILTQCGSQFTDNVITEIFREMDRLKQIKVEESELKTVKSYMIGQHLRSLDENFAAADFLIEVIALDLNEDFFNDTIETIRSTTIDDINNLAIKYLNKENMYISIAGKEKTNFTL